MAPRGSPATSVRYIHFSILSASGFPGTLSEMNASRRKTCSDDTCTNFSTADPVPTESSTSLDEIQRSDLVVQLIGHVSSVLGQGSLRHHVDELLLKGNWFPNQIAVWTEGSWRSSCSTPNWMQCTMISCRELSMIEGSKIPNLISLDKLTDRSSCATPSGHADFCVLDLQFVSCIVTGNGVVQHLHDRNRAYRSHRKLFCSCLQETAARGFRPSHIDASAIEDVHRPVERQREGNEIISSLMSVLWSTSAFDF